MIEFKRTGKMNIPKQSRADINKDNLKKSQIDIMLMKPAPRSA